MTRVGDLGGTRMAEHKCGTCKHYEPAPMWKKGWCRNPLLFSPQQSHLVGEEDLDCNRGMGSYWEPIESEAAEELPLARFAPPRTIAPAGQGQFAGPQQATQVGPTRRERAPRPQATAPMPRPRVRRPEPLATDSPETYAAPPEAHAWGDYLRRSVPAIGVVLLLGIFWIWASAQLPRRAAAPATTAPLATVPANLGQVTVIVPSPTAAPAGAAAAPNGAAPAATFPPPPPGKVAPGAAVVVQSAGDGANIRAQPSINAAVTIAVDSGTPLTVTGPSRDADGYTWWPVQGDGFSGWIAGGLLVPAH
ncbi:MAG TPA: SH3 domain-containing protein [Thermomicrobiales bacterium]|nr:SH3 domain-containing protein [Thermomicrobiales bacterium]